MYSNNIVNFQESATTLNACTKKSGNLLNASRSKENIRLHAFPQSINKCNSATGVWTHLVRCQCPARRPHRYWDSANKKNQFLAVEYWKIMKTCKIFHKIYILLNFLFKFWLINFTLLNIYAVLSHLPTRAPLWTSVRSLTSHPTKLNQISCLIE